MTEIINKITKLRKETMAKMDRLHILLLLSPSSELSKELAYTEDIYLSMLELMKVEVRMLNIRRLLKQL